MRFRRLSAALVIGLIATACGGGDVQTTAESADEAAAASSGPTLTALGTVSTVAGGQLDLGSLDGQDTVLWFWAPW
ncbi:MAG: hypothetical protein ACR2P0_03065 [Acidimicrobiales bacterium]